uniref:B-type natriuretic peptide n=1 Tax=Clupea pallasii TaxID=30724 RepID=W0G1H0_CLUPA|nr:B-type natriuretic peptide [Clupea pallasii]
MQLFHIPIARILAFVNLQLLSGHPVPSGILSSADVDILKVLLHRLEASIPAQRPVASDDVPAQSDADVSLDDTILPGEEDYTQPQSAEPRVSLADVKEFLSARDLKAVRNDSKRYSGCFGRRMDRIGSMTSLGCNTARRNNQKRR